MIFDDILKDGIKNIKKIVLLNNFPEDLQNNIVNRLVELLKDQTKENLDIHRIYEDINLKTLNEYISNNDLFSNKTIFFIYNFSQNVSSLKKIQIPEDIIIFFFIDEKNLNKDEYINIIQFPKSLDASGFIEGFLSQNKITFESYEIKDQFNSFFNSVSFPLIKVCEDILVYLKKTKSNIITKDIAFQFISYSPNFSFFSIINSFFQKDKSSFFHQYIQFVESENDFNSFFQPFLKEIKILVIISSIISDKIGYSPKDKNLIINYFNNINLQYNPYRYQYDMKKIESFGKERFVSLLEFLLTVDIYSRYYDKQSAQKLFEIGINQFI